jgi:HSP20 family protein
LRRGSKTIFRNAGFFSKTWGEKIQRRLTNITVRSSDTFNEETMAKKSEEKDKPKIDMTHGLGGIFKGLGDFLEMAADLAQKAEKLPTDPATGMRVGSFGTPKGLHAVYGVSVRVGAGGQPVVEHFGNMREKPGKGPVVDEVREPIADLLDEDDHFLVVAEMPGMEESAVQWKIKDDILILSSKSEDRKYYKELLLPSHVDENKVSSSYKNGILELKLWKLSAS